MKKPTATVKASKPTATMEKKPRKRRPKRAFSAEQKCRAVLCLWSSNQSALAICRDQGISYNQRDKWQMQAFEAMVEALKPKVKESSQTVLSPRIQRLLARIEEPESR